MATGNLPQPARPFAANDIRRQVDVLVSSPHLANSAQLCRLLRHLVDRTLAGDTGALKESLLGIHVFDRGVRYDPRTDPVVRVEVRRLRTKLEAYYSTAAADPTQPVIRIPKGSYVPVFERASNPRPLPQLMVAAVQPSNNQETRSVAVLPFAAVGADPETEYFADGLTDEVISLLGTIPGLNVVSRSSVYQFKGRTADARELGRKLKASHLVEGSVRRDGQKLRIAVQLVEAANGYQNWTSTFERDWHQIFAIQSEIATAVASKLSSAPSDESVPRSRHYTKNIEAYSALLRGRFYAAKRSVGGFQTAMEAFRQAIRLDPAYAPAWAALADCHTMLGFLNASSPRDARIHAREAVERALALDDQLAEAHVAAGQQLAICEWDWNGCLAALRRALALDPNSPDAHYGMAKTLATLGRPLEALPHIRRARELDPLTPIIVSSLGSILALAGRYDEADQTFRSSQDLDRYFIWTYLIHSWSLQARGLMQDAIQSLRQALVLSPDNSIVQGELAHALGKSGGLEEARQLLDGLLERARSQYISPFDLARAYEGTGQRDLAIEAMQRACEERSPLLLFAGAEPVFDCFRADPRFQQILATMNLAGIR